jgi:hypothetical protein
MFSYFWTQDKKIEMNLFFYLNYGLDQTTFNRNQPAKEND